MTKISLKKSELSEMVQRSINKVLKEELNNNSQINDDPTKRDMLSYLRSKYDRVGYDEDSAEIAMYWFAYGYHGGQWSNLYSVLSTSKYKPGPHISSVSDESDEMAEMMYEDLVSTYGVDSDDYYDTEDDYNPERDSYNYDDNMEESVGDDESLGDDEYNEGFDESDEEDLVDDDLVEYTIPTWAAIAMINADYSGLDDEDEEIVNKFIDALVAKHGNAYVMPGEDKGFQPFNDMTRLGDDVMTVYVRPDNVNESKIIKVSKKELFELTKGIIGKILSENNGILKELDSTSTLGTPDSNPEGYDVNSAFVFPEAPDRKYVVTQFTGDGRVKVKDVLRNNVELFSTNSLNNMLSDGTIKLVNESKSNNRIKLSELKSVILNTIKQEFGEN